MAELPPNVELVHLFAAAESEREVGARLAAMRKDPATRDRADKMLALWRHHPGAYGRVRSVLAVAAATPVPDWSGVFDTAVALDECTAVAVYCLGDEVILQQSTEELVERMVAWNVLGADRVVLDFGCGTGRIASAVASLVRRVLGVDVSPRMVDVARGAVASHANVAIIEAGSLAALRGDRFDAVLAIDSMPYVVESGIAPAVWDAVSDLLEPGGVFLVFNYSHRGDLERDRAEVSEAARRYGFVVERNGTADLTLWDGRAFLVRKAQ